MTSAEYQEALKNAAKSMVRVKNPRRLLRMMTRFIDREVGLSHTSILIHEASKNSYIFVDSKGGQRFPLNLIRLDKDNPIMEWFLNGVRSKQTPKDYLTIELLDYLYEDQKNNGGDPDLLKQMLKVKEAMKTLRAAVCIPGYFKGELLGLLILGAKLDSRPFSEKELAFFQTLTFDAAMAIKNAEYQKTLQERNDELATHLEEIKRLREKEKKNYFQMVLSLATELDEKDHYTFGHTAEVVRWGLLTAKELGLPVEGAAKDALTAALRLHDIGKIGIPDEILKKPSRLTEDEFLLMKEHPKKGARILEPLSDFKEVAKAVLHHHENFDGTGYPAGLKGEEIPHMARLIAVVDSFHAMVSNRPYHKGIAYEEALTEIKRCVNRQFDPEIVVAFERALLKEIEKSAAKASNGSAHHHDPAAVA